MQNNIVATKTVQLGDELLTVTVHAHSTHLGVLFAPRNDSGEPRMHYNAFATIQQALDSELDSLRKLYDCASAQFVGNSPWIETL